MTSDVQESAWTFDAPSASDNPDAPVAAEMPTTMVRVIAMISSRLPVRAAERISGVTT